MTYVVIEIGSKQYRLAKNDIFLAEKVSDKPGKSIKLDRVLLYTNGKEHKVGSPFLKDVKVQCDILGSVKAKKVISFKYKRRKSSRTKIGHRQKYTRLRVSEISAS